MEKNYLKSVQVSKRQQGFLRNKSNPFYLKIQNGIWFEKPYAINGSTYYFITDEEAIKKSMK
ncbi:hypothetical protein J2Z82_002285 [Virgibacillus litoralis]|uniref:Uncharacterized protein n=1 Tax=Virgibacillus litoralis TaxID=578221 RepID=A0ABS4HER5_9BACI|nr:hypothetical protein [Virgibacillus litoralis]